MEDLSLHILDVVENSLRASAQNVSVTIVEDEENDTLLLVIDDDGAGMDEETRNKAVRPFFTSKEGKRFGLGLPLLAQAAQEGGGALTLESQEGRGTRVCATFRLSHVDTRPLGDIDESIRVLRATNPHVSFSYEHRKGGRACPS